MVAYSINDDNPLEETARVNLYRRAILEGWDIPPDERRKMIDALKQIIVSGKRETARVQAFRALTDLIDKNFESERIDIEWARLELAKGGIDAGLPSCQAKDENGQPLDP